MSRRFYDPQPFQPSQTVTLGEGPSHHIAKVLRMRVGDDLVVFNGDGGEYAATLTDVGKKSVAVAVHSFEADNRTPVLDVTLALPLIKGDRMDFAIQKATEMGVRHIHLVQCERSDVRINGDRKEKKLSHYRQVIISACEQCGLNIVPSLDGITPLTEFLSDRNLNGDNRDAEKKGLSFIAHPGLAAVTTETVSNATSVCLLTGPEGGFSDKELEIAAQKNFIPFTLGERVLRAETAPVALLGALWALAN